MNEDLISRSALSEKLQTHHDFFVNAWGGFSNLPIKDKIRVDEITNCIAEVMNAPAVDAVDADKALEWLEGYTFTDTKRVYTNGTVLVPLFRVRQALKDKAYNGLMEG